MDVADIVVGGAFRTHVQLKKCTWIKCCYGKKHYHGPRHRGGGRRGKPGAAAGGDAGAVGRNPAIKIEGAAGPVVQAVAVSGGGAGVPARALDRDVCRGCLPNLAAVNCAPAPGQLDPPCKACRALLATIDGFAGRLPLPAELPAAVGEAGLAFRRRLRVAMVAALARIELKPLLTQVDPILLDALASRYGVESASALWDLSAEARTTLGRLICSSYGVGNDLHSKLIGVADTVMSSPEQAAVLRAIPASDFLSSWHASLQPSSR